MNQTYAVVPVDSLHTLSPNPRKGDLKVIGASIKTNGFYNVCVVQKSTNVIIAGNHRYLSAVEQGLTEIPVVFIDVTDEQARRIAIADNRTADIGSYDNHVLTELLKSMDSPSIGTGYDDADIQRLIEIDRKTHEVKPPSPPPTVQATDLAYDINGVTVQVRVGDNRKILAELPENSIDSVVTDPPYEFGFMGKSWDSSGIAYSVDLWKAVLRVLKPGGHLLAFGAPRNYHRMAVAIEDAGFEIRDSIHWIFGSGFPKSSNISKNIDKMADAEREVTEIRTDGRYAYDFSDKARNFLPTGELDGKFKGPMGVVTAAATPVAEQYDGYGTGLRPAHEPIVLARKPLIGTATANVLEYGTGALNIDAARVPTYGEKLSPGVYSPGAGLGPQNPAAWHIHNNRHVDPALRPDTNKGRTPPNLVFSHLPECVETGTTQVPRKATEMYEGGVKPFTSRAGEQRTTTIHPDETVPTYDCSPGCPVAELDNSQPHTTSRSSPGGQSVNHISSPKGGILASQKVEGPHRHDDSGGKSRYFPCFVYHGKATPQEKPRDDEGHTHTTIKPLGLMRWLIRLVTPDNGTVLDMFAGSGTTLEAALLEHKHSIGIEQDHTYINLIKNRLSKYTDVS